MKKFRKWTFDNLANRFDDHIRRSVFSYDDMQDLIGIVSQWFLKDKSTVYNLGSSTSETELRIIKYNPKVKIEFNCVDIDKKMLRKAREKIKKKRDKSFKFNFLEKDINKLNFKKSNLIISFLTTPFLSSSERNNLFKKSYKSLSENGAFILVEKISSFDPHIQDIFNQVTEEKKIENNLSMVNNFQKKRKLRGILQTYDLNKTLLKLKNTGFTKTDILFKSISFTCFICIKD